MNTREEISPEKSHEHDGRFMPTLRGLIWLYFLLLMFDGVLRKWVLPGISNELLLVRDPVLFAIYFLALSAGLSVFNPFVLILAALGGAAVFTGLTVGSHDLIVTGYGFDACFLHLPLIFIIPEVMDRRDVVNIGRAVLWLALPMSLLMVIQFRSSPDAWINCGAGGGIGAQIRGAMGKIRPPGVFTFITGAAQYLAFATTFLIFGFLRKGTYSKFLLYLAGLSVVISAVVSTSRLALGGIGIVFLMVGVIVFFNRENIGNVLRLLLPIGLILVVATTLDVFHEGRGVFEARMQEAGDTGAGFAGTAVNWTQRIFGDFLSGAKASQNAPILGHGLGLGTNVGAKLVSGETGFLLAEGEQARVILEMGPILGAAYLLTRMAIALTLFVKAARSIRDDNFLPILLFGSCGLLLISGQFSQSTTLGFSVLIGGLCLAARNLDPAGENGELSALDPAEKQVVVPKRRGRGIHAEALHRSVANDQSA